jgi:hypothetical protein
MTAILQVGGHRQNGKQTAVEDDVTDRYASARSQLDAGRHQGKEDAGAQHPQRLNAHLRVHEANAEPVQGFATGRRDNLFIYKNVVRLADFIASYGRE